MDLPVSASVAVHGRILSIELRNCTESVSFNSLTSARQTVRFSAKNNK